LCPGKERAPNDLSSSFKEKEKEGEGKSKAWCQWNVPNLVANGMFQTWWPMEGAIAWWPMEGEGKTPFHFFPFPPQQILLKLSIFSFDLKFLLYHGSRPLLTPFFPLHRSINYDYTSQCNKSFTPFSI